MVDAESGFATDAVVDPSAPDALLDSLNQAPETSSAVPDAIVAPPAEVPSPSPIPEPTAPVIDPAEYQRLQTELASKQDLISQIEQAAQEQRRHAEEQRFAQQGQGTLKQVLDHFSNVDSTDALATNLWPYVEQIIQGAIESRDAEWQERWTSEAVPYQTQYRADHLIRELGLPAEVRDSLLQIPDWNQMHNYAQSLKSALAQQAVDQRQTQITQQRDQQRASGVHAVGGVTGRPAPPREYKEMSARDSVPFLQELLSR